MAMVPGKSTKSRGLLAAASSSFSKALGRTVVDFGSSWKANATLKNGTKVEAEYNINEPSDGPAHFNMLLDASGSMFHVQASADGGRDKHVYEHLFECFDELVASGEALRPDDMICVWSFNQRTKLLYEVQTKNYHKKKDDIRKVYENELKSDTWNGETRLYDAVAHVMDKKLVKTWKANKKADFFLVTFTDGRDTRTGSTSLDSMIQKLNELVGRLHTFFITINLPTNSDLSTKLALQKEMKLIHCKSTHPSEISRAFNTVRDLIKAVLVIVTKEAGALTLPRLTRIVEYAKTKESIGDKMMSSLATRNGSLIEAYGKLQLTSN